MLRKLTLMAVVSAAVLLTAPAFAAKKPIDGVPSFSDCFDLGWVRGVHLENNELPAWIEECQAGGIGMPIEHAVSAKEKARARHGKPAQAD